MRRSRNRLKSLVVLAPVLVSILSAVLPCVTHADADSDADPGFESPPSPPPETAPSVSTDAEPHDVPETPASPVPALPLEQPLAPRPSVKDWIQLQSGEWLRGSLKRMRDGNLDFDSDELGDLEIDWKKVVEVRSPLPHTYVFERDRKQFSLTGPAKVDTTTVFIRLADEVHSFPRSELVAILRGESRRDYWSGSLTVGVTLRTGNTEQVDVSSLGWLRRETDRTRVRFDYNGLFGSFTGETNSNSHRALISFDYFVTRKLYVTPLLFEAFTDPFQNISYRLTPSVGVGYKLVRWRSVEWDVDFGGGYQYTRFDSVLPGEPESQKGGALVFGTRFETDITKRTDVEINYKLNLAVGDAQTSHHAELIFSVDLYKMLDLDLTLTWDRIEDPPPGSDGQVPKENDARLAVGLGIDF